MFEYDDDGEEWIGYTFGCEETDNAAVISALTGNVQYLEWVHERHPEQAVSMARTASPYLRAKLSETDMARRSDNGPRCLMAFSHPVELEPMIQKSLKTSSVQIEKFSSKRVRQ